MISVKYVYYSEGKKFSTLEGFCNSSGRLSPAYTGDPLSIAIDVSAGQLTWYGLYTKVSNERWIIILILEMMPF